MSGRSLSEIVGFHGKCRASGRAIRAEFDKPSSMCLHPEVNLEAACSGGNEGRADIMPLDQSLPPGHPAGSCICLRQVSWLAGHRFRSAFPVLNPRTSGLLNKNSPLTVAGAASDLQTFS